MISKKLLLSFIFSIFLGGFAGSGGAAEQPTASQGVTFSETQWMAVQDRFEHDISALITWFEKYETDKKNLVSEISTLQEKTSHLRNETKDQSNVFKEIHLKELLNKLKDKLEENSSLDRDADLKQKDFEEKCLSLIELYNSRIEYELGAGDLNATPAQWDSKINLLSGLARKRNRIQTLLSRYRKRDDKEKLVSLRTVSSMDTNDIETLQLTLDLFNDRQKSLQDQIEKWTLELDGLKNELKLQGEMKDFLKDIQSMNEDANFPQSNLKQEDLDFLSGDSQKKKLNSRLNEVQQKVLRGQKLLAQINQLLVKVRDRLNSLNEGKKP